MHLGIPPGRHPWNAAGPGSAPRTNPLGKPFAAAPGRGGGRAPGAGRPGFSLVELLVVVAIIGLLVALLLPAAQAAREAARRTQCANHLRQIGLAMHLYDQTSGHLPPAGIQGRGSASAFLLILPWLEQSAIRDQYEIGTGLSAAAQAQNNRIIEQSIETYLCPSMFLPRQVPNKTCGETGAAASYALSIGTNNPWPLNSEFNGAFVQHPERERTSLAGISRNDGTAHTLMVGELDYGLRNFTWLTCFPSYGQIRGGSTVWWIGYAGHSWASTYGVYDSELVTIPGTNWEWATFRSDHPGGCNFLMCDSSVRFIGRYINAEQLDALATWRGEEPLGDSF